MFVYDQNSGKYIKAAQTGYTFNPNAPTVPQATYSGNIEKTVVLSPQQTTQVNALGLDFKPASTSGKNAGQAGNGVEVQATVATPGWLKSVLGKNGATNMYTAGSTNPSDPTYGNLQFQASSVSGQGKAVYTVTKNNQLWESSNLGDRLLSGSPTQSQQQQPTSFWGRVSANFWAGVNHAASLTNGGMLRGNTTSNMVNQATNHFELPPIPVAKPTALPPLSVMQPLTQPALPVANAPTLAPATNPQQTANPQPAASGSSIQGGGSGISLQGGGGAAFALQ